MAQTTGDPVELDPAVIVVPSPRELEAGLPPRPEDDEQAYSAQPRVRPQIGRGAIGFLRQLDIRDITAHGPALPLILVGYLGFIGSLDAAVMNLFLPELKNEFGLSLGLFVAMGQLLGILTALVAPVMGFIADRVRRVTLLAIGAVISHGSIALRGTAGSVGGLVGYSALGAVGGSLGAPVGYPLLADWYPPQSRGRVFAFLALTSTLGGVAAPLIAGVVGDQLGWRESVEIFGGAATVLSLSFFLLKEPVRGIQDRLAAGAPLEVARREQRPVTWTEAWRAAASIRTLRLIWFVSIPTAITAGAVGPTLQLYYVAKFNMSVLDRGFIASLSAIPVIIGLAASGPVTDRILAYKPGRIMPLLGGLSLFGVAGLLVLVYTPFLALAVLLNAVPSFFTALMEPAIMVISTLIVPPRIRGLGLQTAAPFRIVGAIGAIIFANYIQYAGLDTGITVAAVVGVATALIFLFGGGRVEEDIRAARAASLADESSREAQARGEGMALVIRDLDVVYDAAKVLFGVDLDIREGELLALLGTNGAGKSTLLRAIAGVQQASNGAIFLRGDDITHLPPEQIAQRGVVLMPGGQAVFPTLTVEQNLRTAAWMNRRDPTFVRAAIAESLERFPRLRDRLQVRAGDLSGGEQQMVALSQALLMRPNLLMIDELSLGLAPQVVEMLLETVREINRRGTTVVVVEQSISVALQIAQRAVYMEKGEIQFDGPVRELFERPDIVRSVFLGGAATAGELGRSSGRRILGLEEEREDVLQIAGVTLRYGGVAVLSGVSLDVRAREVVGLIGPNGAGKTSLFDVVSGFAGPQEGTVGFLGRDITRLRPDARARLGLARSYQNVRLFPALTVRENIAVALARHLGTGSVVLAAVGSPTVRRSERRVNLRVENLIESLGLETYANKFVSELSTGTRRIVDIACQLAAQPRLLLLDEPSSGLAQAETEQLGPVIQRIVKETGCAVLIIEHDLGLVASVSDRLIALRLGEIMAEGSPQDVLADRDVVDALLGGASDAVVSRSIQLTGAHER